MTGPECDRRPVRDDHDMLDIPTPYPITLRHGILQHSVGGRTQAHTCDHTHIHFRTSYAQRARNVSLAYGITGPIRGADSGRRAILPLF